MNVAKHSQNTYLTTNKPQNRHWCDALTRVHRSLGQKRHRMTHSCKFLLVFKPLHVFATVFDSFAGIAISYTNTILWYHPSLYECHTPPSRNIPVPLQAAEVSAPSLQQQILILVGDSSGLGPQQKNSKIVKATTKLK